MKLLAAMALAAALLTGAPAQADDAADPVVAQRGSIVLTASQIKQLVRLAEPETRQRLEHDPALLAQKVRERMLQLVLLNEAKNQKWDQRPDVVVRAELARQNAIIESFAAAQVPDDPAFPTDDQLQKAYDANKSKLIIPRQYHLAQIFIAAPPSSGVQGDADGLRRINEIKTQLTKQHADFAALAKKLSEDAASSGNGGDLGWIREDGVIPPIRAAVTGLAEGAISDPVRSQEGWHLVKLIGTKPAAPATLAESRETLTRALKQERSALLQRNYITGLIQGEPIQVNEIEIGKLIAK